MFDVLFVASTRRDIHAISNYKLAPRDKFSFVVNTSLIFACKHFSTDSKNLRHSIQNYIIPLFGHCIATWSLVKDNGVRNQWGVAR